jgi:hypothetical protein
MERWKDIPGFEGHYQASDQGRVRSLPRVTSRGLRLKQRYMSLTVTPAGYQFVTFGIDGERFVKMVAQLVMLTFVGPPPKGKEVCHNDGNKQNNVLKNLRYDTRKANMHDRKLHGEQPFGSELPWAKLTEKQVIKIRELYQPPIGRDWGRGRSTTRKWTLTALAQRYNVSVGTIGLIINRNTWPHV